MRLTSRSFLHLTPEVVQFEAELPFYAKVLHLAADEVTFRSLEGVEGTIDRGIAEERVVLASEVTHSGRVSLLRRPVSVKLEGEVHYGPVVAVDNNQLSVRSGDRQLSTVTSAVSVVPPVVALLLEDAAFQSDEWSASDLAIVEQTILRRALGRDGEVASNDVSIILDGVTSEESHPVGNKECQWIDPTLGEAPRFPLHTLSTMRTMSTEGYLRCHRAWEVHSAGRQRQCHFQAHLRCLSGPVGMYRNYSIRTPMTTNLLQMFKSATAT
jgi:hypothetical protein